jgi:TetR/AcrR family transcriptional repressor of lmrAB and yxaGH operons
MLDTTATLLRRQGYHGTGLNQIVAEADAPKGSMYFHFPGGKEQLAAEAVIAEAERLDAYLARHQAATAIESVDAYVAAAARWLERSGYVDGCPIATIALELAAGSDRVGVACKDALELLTRRVAGWIEADGHDADVAHERAAMFYATYEGALMFARVSRSTAPLEQLRKALHYLLPSPASTPA